MKLNTVLQIASRKGVIRASDVSPLGVSPNYLYDLASQGLLTQVARGLFTMPRYRATEHHGLVEVAAYAPAAVICLLSALQFHGTGTQMPHAVWIAIPHRGRVPHVTTAPIEVVRMNAVSLSAGVQEHVLEGVPVRVFSPAKTVADCFKYRSSVGLDVAIEALKQSLRDGVVTPADLHQYAVIDRVWENMRPYVEALQ